VPQTTPTPVLAKHARRRAPFGIPLSRQRLEREGRVIFIGDTRPRPDRLRGPLTARPAPFDTIPVDAILDNASAALFLMDAEHRCTYMNPATEALTGFTLDEARGRILHEMVHHTRPDGSHYPIGQCPIGCSLLQSERARGEEVFVHRDGRFYDVAYAASLIHERGEATGAVLEVQDITERVHVHKELRLSEARFRTIAVAMPQMVWSTRADGTADYFNRQFATFTGRPLETFDDAT
jgi:PAS domain S-box-containing protein